MMKIISRGLWNKQNRLAKKNSHFILFCRTADSCEEGDVKLLIFISAEMEGSCG
jgi:hypothetical protein